MSQPSWLFSLKQALWIDAAAAAPTHAPRRNSGPGGDQWGLARPRTILSPWPAWGRSGSPPSFFYNSLRQNDQGTEPVPSQPDSPGYPRPVYRCARVGVAACTESN